MSGNTETGSFQMREMKAELGLLSKSDGSAMFSQGNCCFCCVLIFLI